MRPAAVAERDLARHSGRTVPRGALAVGVLVVLLVRRWYQLGEFTPGLDQGNWLAFGRKLFGDADSVLDSIPLFTIPPAIPVLLASLTSLTDPMTAANVLSLLSLAAVFAAVYAVASRTLSEPIAVGAATLVTVSSSVLEPAAFGGYPQNVAFGALVFAAGAASRYVASDDRASYWMVGGGLLVAALTHHMYFLMALAGVGGVWLLWLLDRPDRRLMLTRTTRLGLAAAPALVAFSPTAVSLLSSSYQPAINASASSHLDAFRYAFPDPTWLWAIVLASGIGSLAARYRTRTPLWRTAAALILLSVLPFALTAESRLLPPLTAGALLGLGMAIEDLRWRARAPRLAGGAAAAIALSALLLVADQRADIAFDFFRVVDRSTLDTAEWLEVHADGRVAVREDRRGWPVGWWFRGLTDGEFVVGSQERWLAFTEEVSDARVARELFAAASADEARAVASRYRVTIAVARKWEWIGWRRWVAIDQSPVPVLYDDGTYIVLDLRGS